MDGTPMPRRGWGMVIIIAPLLMGAVLRGWGSNGATGGEGICGNGGKSGEEFLGCCAFGLGKRCAKGRGKIDCGLGGLCRPFVDSIV